MNVLNSISVAFFVLQSYFVMHWLAFMFLFVMASQCFSGYKNLGTMRASHSNRTSFPVVSIVQIKCSLSSKFLLAVCTNKKDLLTFDVYFSCVS